MNSDTVSIQGSGDAVITQPNGLRVVLPPNNAPFYDASGLLFDRDTYYLDSNVQMFSVLLTVFLSAVLGAILSYLTVTNYNRKIMSQGSFPNPMATFAIVLLTFSFYTVSVTWFIVQIAQVFGYNYTIDNVLLATKSSSALSSAVPKIKNTMVTPPIVIFSTAGLVRHCTPTYYFVANTTIYAPNSITYTKTPGVSITVISDISSYRGEQCTWFGYSDPCSGRENCYARYTETTSSFF